MVYSKKIMLVIEIMLQIVPIYPKMLQLMAVPLMFLQPYYNSIMT